MTVDTGDNWMLAQPGETPVVSPERVEKYFAQYGWAFETVEPGLWRTGFRGASDFHVIVLRLTDHWMYMSISPFVDPPEAAECRAQCYEAMLQYNREMNLAKFVLDEDNDVTLTVELPIEALSYTVFSEGLTALAYYADDLYPELNALATDPKTISRFRSLNGHNLRALSA